MSDRIATVACVEASGLFQFSRRSDFFFLFFPAQWSDFLDLHAYGVKLAV